MPQIKVRVYLNDQLVDLGKPVTIRVNGKQVFQGIVKADLQAMVNSCTEYFDPCRVYPVDIRYVDARIGFILFK